MATEPFQSTYLQIMQASNPCCSNFNNYMIQIDNKKVLTFLLSSNTVFMFSIHTASTGPSKIIHFRSSVVFDANSRNVLASTPVK